MRKSQSRERILVVDDDPDIRLALEMSLNYHGYEVLVAKDGEEALARLKKEQDALASVAMVLTDLKMPGLSGMDVVRALSESPSPPRVILITAHGSVDRAREAHRLGALLLWKTPTNHASRRPRIR